MTALILAVLAGYGTHLMYSALSFGWSGFAIADGRSRRRRIPVAKRFTDWLHQAGLDDVRPQEFLGATALLAIFGAVVGLALFGGFVPALAIAGFAATTPYASYRVRRANRLAAANDGWPQMIEEIRILTGSVGRSIPQALLEVGKRGPVELRGAFEAAAREWALSTDFERTVELLKERLAHPTADATCETLLVAHEVGAGDLDRRLAELAEDRRIDNLGRKDARAKQAGVRFARRFVIGVPFGMALAGLSFGEGRESYQSPMGQALVAVGLGLIAACWVWSGSMLRHPEQRRVFD